jgi:ATP-dependent exoDNAse (exonuclease V) alpha subunit
MRPRQRWLQHDYLSCRVNNGQWQAAVGLLESANRVCLVEGPAGSGKSYLLKKFDEGMRLAGEETLYFAPTSDAVAVLEKDGFAAQTVARFLVDDKLQAAARGCRLVIDEASLLGHKDAYRLTRLAEKLDLRLVYVGDPMQHGSVPRGALLTVLKDYGQVKPFTLREIRRQEDPGYRAAVASLSAGDTLAGFDAIDKKGWVKDMADPTDRLRHAAADYVQALDDQKTVIAISPTHRDAARLNEEIRRQLRQGGKIGVDDHAYTRLVAADATEAERGEAIYQPGDVIQFTQNAKGFKKGQRLIVTDPAMVPVEQAGKFQLYRKQEVSLAVGDVLRFTSTVNTRDGGKLRNGELRTIDAFLADGDIRLTNGMVVPADAGHFRLGYVDTSFSSQGRTTQRAIVSMSADSLPAVNQEQLYVSASRAKEKLTIYTDDKESVREAIQRSSRKRAALDLLDQPSPAAGRSAALQRHLGRQRRLSLLSRVHDLWQHRPWRPVLQPVLERASHERY